MEKERDLDDKQTANTHIVINVATERDFGKNCITRRATDIVDLDSVKKYRLHRDASFEEFRARVKTPYGISFMNWCLRLQRISKYRHLLSVTGFGNVERTIHLCLTKSFQLLRKKTKN